MKTDTLDILKMRLAAINSAVVSYQKSEMTSIVRNLIAQRDDLISFIESATPASTPDEYHPSDPNTHYRADGSHLNRWITHANQRNRQMARIHSYWKRKSRKTERITRHDQLMEAISDWHVQLAEEAEEAEAARLHASEQNYRDEVDSDINDQIDQAWKEYTGENMTVPPQPTRQELEAEHWEFYERCPLIRLIRTQKWGF